MTNGKSRQLEQVSGCAQAVSEMLGDKAGVGWNHTSIRSVSSDQEISQTNGK